MFFDERKVGEVIHLIDTHAKTHNTHKVAEKANGLSPQHWRVKDHELKHSIGLTHLDASSVQFKDNKRQSKWSILH